MRILIANQFAGIVGGVETYLKALIPELQRRGHAVGFLTELPPSSREQPIVLEGSETAQWHFTSGEETVFNELTKWRPDVCLLNGFENPSYERILASRYPTLFFSHGYYGTCIGGNKMFSFPGKSPCSRVFGTKCLAFYFPSRCGGLSPLTMIRQFNLQGERQHLLRQYRRVAVASNHMYSEYTQHGIEPERLVLLPYFVPGQQSDPEPPAQRPVQNRILFIGRLVEAKGVEVLIDAAFLAQELMKCRLNIRIAGDGPCREKLERKCAGRNDLDVEFVGWVNAARRIELMRDSDILAVPSIWPEPFGLVGIEAGCVGLPSVAFDVGGISDWLKDGVSGKIAPGNPPTAQGLAEAMASALNDSVRLHSFGTGAWQISKQFSLSNHLDCLQRALQETAGIPLEL